MASYQSIWHRIETRSILFPFLFSVCTQALDANLSQPLLTFLVFPGMNYRAPNTLLLNVVFSPS